MDKTAPLSHLENYFEKLNFEIQAKRLEWRKLGTILDTLDEVRMEVKDIIAEERKKLQPRGDSQP